MGDAQSSYYCPNAAMTSSLGLVPRASATILFMTRRRSWGTRGGLWLWNVGLCKYFWTASGLRLCGDIGFTKIEEVIGVYYFRDGMSASYFSFLLRFLTTYEFPLGLVLFSILNSNHSRYLKCVFSVTQVKLIFLSTKLVDIWPWRWWSRSSRLSM